MVGLVFSSLAETSVAFSRFPAGTVRVGFAAAVLLGTLACEPALDLGGGGDAGPRLVVEGAVDSRAGIELFVSTSAPFGAVLTEPSAIGRLDDAEVYLVDSVGERTQVPHDTLGRYVLPSWRCPPGASYELSVRAAGLPSASVGVRIPTAPEVEVLGLRYVAAGEDPSGSSITDGYVATLRASSTTNEGAPLLVGGAILEVTNGVNDVRSPRAQGFILASEGSGCRTATGPDVSSAGCTAGGRSIVAELVWRPDTSPDTLRGRVSAVAEEAFIDYIETHFWNSTNWESEGELFYPRQQSVPSNVDGGYGFVRGQTSALITLPVP